MHIISKIKNKNSSEEEICKLLNTHIHPSSQSYGFELDDLYTTLMTMPNRIKCIDTLYSITSYFSEESLHTCILYLNTDTFIYCIERGFEMEWNSYQLLLSMKTRFAGSKYTKKTLYREMCKIFRCLFLYSDSYFYNRQIDHNNRQIDTHTNRYFKSMEPRLSYLYSYITNEEITEAIDFIISEYTHGKANDQYGDWWIQYILSNRDMCKTLMRDEIAHSTIHPEDNPWTKLVHKQIEYVNKLQKTILDTLYFTCTPFLVSSDVIKYCIFPYIYCY